MANASDPKIWVCSVSSTYVNSPVGVSGLPQNNDALSLAILPDGAIVIHQKTGVAFDFSDIFSYGYGLVVRGASIGENQVTGLAFTDKMNGTGLLRFSMTGIAQWGVMASCQQDH